MTRSLSPAELLTAADLLPLFNDVDGVDAQQLPTQFQLSTIIPSHQGNDFLSAISAIQQIQKTIVDTIRRKHQLQEKERAASKLQKRYKLNKKPVHAEILDIRNNTGGPATSNHLSPMTHPIKKTICSTPDTVLNALAAHHRILNSPKTPPLTTPYPPWISPHYH